MSTTTNWGAALEHISTDVSMIEWVKCAAALMHQFPSGDDNKRAFSLFDEWSSHGDKYVGEKDTRARWRSLKANPLGRKPVTIRTLFHMAEATGQWSRTERADAIARRDAHKAVNRAKGDTPAAMARAALTRLPERMTVSCQDCLPYCIAPLPAPKPRNVV